MSGNVSLVLQVVARIPAKINLALSVGPVRPDGFHELATVYHAVSLYDDVAATHDDGVHVTLTGPYGGDVPADSSNLAARAALLLAHREGVRSGVRLAIHKAIPVAAGLAGGSADAAGALLACDRLWDLSLPAAQLASVGATLGSDVPFALAGGTALGSGRGERIRPVPVGGTLHWVLAVADGGLSTPAVYRCLDVLRVGRRVPQPGIDEALLTALEVADVDAIAGLLHNDLQEAAIALRPSLAATLQAGDDLGALGGLVSGSGPTCAFLASDAEHAVALADGLIASGTCADAIPVTGPAPMPS